MEAHIEKEYKMLLKEEDYRKMMETLQISAFLQTNYYYDCGFKDRTMRIREVKGHYIFTLKVKKEGYKEEYEFEIADRSFDDERITRLLSDFGIVQYRYLGKMDTYRAVKEMKYGEICLDHSLYHETSDYEIEYELYDANVDGFEEFRIFLAGFGLSYDPAPYTKYRRFLNTIKERI